MLADRLRAARHAQFVGRTSEKDQFHAAITDTALPYFVLHIFGPGGVGKTTLLQEYNLMCERAQVRSVYLDARNIEPTPDAFSAALRMGMGLGATDSLRATLAEQPRLVLLVDTYEAIAALDDWLRDVFMPSLGDNILVVLAGRNPPASGWRADPGWQSLMCVVALRNLAPDEGICYLERRRVPTEQYRSVLSFTHGHPLALSLIADAFVQRPDMEFEPEVVPDIVQTLLAQFAREVPGAAYRAALEACSLVRLMTESLLADMLAVDDAHAIFEWLQGLSFIDNGVEGVFPHDLAREALASDLRWRNPEWYATLHDRARKHYFQRFQQSTGVLQQRILIDYIYLHRHNPLVKPFFEWQGGGGFIADAMQPTDMTPLMAMVAQHEGMESRHIAKYWFQRQPENVLVVRDAKRRPVGFVIMLAVERTNAEDDVVDPALKSIKAFLAHQIPLRQGERVTLFRHWMAHDTYQDVSPVQSLLIVNMVRHYLVTPRLAYAFAPCADPDMYHQPFSYADFHRFPQADYTVGERTYGVYGHDWRIMPPLSWLELLGTREIATAPNTTPLAPTEQVIVLSESEFADAVLDALRDYPRPDLLHDNPLLRSRLVMERTVTSEEARVQVLRGLVRETAETMQSAPREAKFYRALYHTYIQPAATQEAAAELLDLPFSSFRRHLKSGIERVTELLWAQEIGGLGV
ncbi:MAG: ATP-binding protein [Chloroflexota bacterium]|nr:ATP-binding protein [Chloroflexota bacterium]